MILSLQDPIPQLRLKPKEKAPAQEPFKSLVAARRGESEENYSACLKGLSSAATKAKTVAPWLLNARIRCAYKLDGRQQIDETLRALKQLDKNKDWLVLGPYAPKLRANAIEARFAILDELVKKDRAEAARVIDDLLALTDWMDAPQRAKAYRLAGELAFLQQKLRKSETYLRASLAQRDSPEAKERLSSLMILMKEKGLDSPEATPRPLLEPDAILSPKEKELSDRMATALKTGDIVAAAEDGLTLIREFPGGQKAKWASDRVFEIYQSIANKDEQKYQSLKERVVDQMEKADGTRLQTWAEKAFRSGYYADVITFADNALKKLEGSPATSPLMSLLAHAHLYTGDDAKAKKMFQTILEKNSGTSEATTAQLRLGLIEYRAKEYAAAIAHFERLLALPDAANFELQARYWLWRSLQRLDDKARAATEAAALATRFPLTYYGLRAQAETSENLVALPESQVKFKAEIDFNGTERSSWERMQVLLKAGWYEEAQLELAELIEPADPVTKALLSRYWASAMGYSKALKIMNQAWTQDPGLQVAPLIRIVFPFEYKEYVEQEAKKYGMEPALVWSLIRQESAFESKAVSSSGALGLMQLIPPTGQEVAQDLRLKTVTGRESFFIPALNIQMGTYYLNKMLRKFEGNVAFALAAYNAGPERFGRWLRSRGQINAKNSDPENETWMDDLPWSETNFYVKAILRNLLIYRSLDRGRVPLLNPVWANEAVEKK
ncbi:MAG TPA: transglycosylase SLT domain-containing protein [Bdellovibrionales bacterium]|nr:transglycosylase SLT domain-containing protein [Bdellovibrionales bacterium]